jgi:uncharacterized membrane protein YbhN (UPF0104 family)
VLFLMTSAVNAATLALAGLLVAAGVFDSPHRVLLGLVPALAGLAVLALFASIPALARRFPQQEGSGRLVRWLHTTAFVVEDIFRELRHPHWRLLGAVAYLWFDIAMLWVCFRAFGESPSIGVVTLGFLIGYLGNIVPVPGGIGALDGGLTAALILYGVDPASAAAAVLLYHAFVLWIPTLIGTIAFLRLRRTLYDPVVLGPSRFPEAEQR